MYLPRFCKRRIPHSKTNSSRDSQHRTVRFAELSMYTVSMMSRSPSVTAKEDNQATDAVEKQQEDREEDCLAKPSQLTYSKGMDHPAHLHSSCRL